MQVIVTKFLGPTNRRGSRVKATLGDNSALVPYRHELDWYGNCLYAKNALLSKLDKWSNTERDWVGGSYSSDKMVWVYAPTEERKGE